MNDYEKLRDSLICTKNDEIDNAAFDLMNAIVKKKDEDDQKKALDYVIGSLMPEGPAPDFLSDGDLILAYVKGFVDAMGITAPGEDEDVEWDMEYINDVTEAVISQLDGKGLNTCHPFFTADEDGENYDEENDGILCCLSSERCEWCPKSNALEG